MIHQMKKINPDAKFYDCPSLDKAGCAMCNSCEFMALNNLEKLYLVMKYGNDSTFGRELNLPEDLRKAAEKPLRKMLEMS
jgi:quinolinate synthase